MQSLQSRSKGKNRFKKVALVAVLVALLGGVGSLYALKLGPFSSTEQSPVNRSDEQNKESPTDTTSDNDKPADQPVPAEPADPTSDSVKNPANQSDDVEKSDEKLTITSAQVNEGTFSIRTLISDITQSGTCTLTMTSDTGKNYTASAGVQAVARASTCKGFDVPLSSLGSGTWKITVTYLNGHTSYSAGKEVVINA